MKNSFIAVIAILCSQIPQWAMACAVCFGEADQQTKNAINGAVLFMIGITLLVLLGVTVMVVQSLKRMAKKKAHS